MPVNLLLTGRPGVGKTTLVRRVLDELENVVAAGFYTAEIRVGGKRQGFRAVTLDGQAAILAHVDIPGPPRVGRYGVDIAAFERLVLPALAPDRRVQLVVMDEIGKMECFSHAFRQAVLRALEADTPLLATIALGHDRFIEGLKARRDVMLIEVTLAQRSRLIAQLVTRLKAEWRGRPG